MDQNKLDYISNLIKEGYSSGYYPTWQLNVDHDNCNDEEHTKEQRMEYIASLVKEGFTSGYYPTWNIEIEEDEDQEDYSLWTEDELETLHKQNII